MADELGLRERKKQATRGRITAVALALFDEHGFDKVPVSWVAREAEVSEATVFNYFPTKEDLVYAGMEAYEGDLLEAVRGRPKGTSVVSAFREHVLQPRGALASADPALVEQIAVTARVVAGSSALQAREQQIVDRATGELADLVAAERRPGIGDMESWVVANALMGVSRAAIRVAHTGACEGWSARRIARAVVTRARRSFAVLEQGLPD
jgi:AcrR family transcriptional regulator